MARLPEDVFDEFFQRLGAADRETYKGRKDLSTLSDQMRSFLVTMREQIMTALVSEGKTISEHVDHPPFYFDYVESRVPNALAFRDRDESYSFVGITMPLFEDLASTSKKLCASDVVLNILSRGSPGCYDTKALFATLVRTQLLFILSHEYAHHVHGHLIPGGSGSAFSNEIVNHGEHGTLDQQVCELDADGYATFLVLADLIDGASRSLVAGALKLDVEMAEVQDEALLLCFVFAAVSFFCVREPAAVESAQSVYQLTHPPQSVRIDFLMHFAVSWCTQFRPGLESTMTGMRFQEVMSSIVTATWGIEHPIKWGAQMAFLNSEDGTAYRGELGRRLNLLASRRKDIPPPQPLTLVLTLVAAPDDPSLNDPSYQRGLIEVVDELTHQGVEVSSHIALREAVGSTASYFGEFGIRLAVALVPALCAAVGAWLHARYGRKVRVKIGEKEIEAEAQTIGDVEKLLKLGEEFKERNRPKVIK
jgi:hypothetical protein